MKKITVVCIIMTNLLFASERYLTENSIIKVTFIKRCMDECKKLKNKNCNIIRKMVLIHNKIVKKADNLERKGHKKESEKAYSNGLKLMGDLYEKSSKLCPKTSIGISE